MKNLFVAMCAMFLGLSTSVASADQVGSGFIRPDETKSMVVTLPADGPMIFDLRGGGGGHIDCAVFDEYGNLRAVDTRPLDGCRLVVEAIIPGEFRYVITNVGRVSSYYTYRLY